VTLERRAHVLSPIARVRYPKRFLFFDSEARVDDFSQFRPTILTKPHRPRLVCAEAWETTGSVDAQGSEVYRESSHPTFEGPDLCGSFWEWASREADRRLDGERGGSLVALAHNVGYDVASTEGSRYLRELGWTPGGLYEKGPVYIWRWAKNRRTLSLLSSTNFYAVKLKKLGETFGTSKMEVDTQTDDLDLLRAYCQRDVTVVREAILGLVRFLSARRPDGSQLGPWADTISSVAFRAFRHLFMDTEIWLHVDPIATALERAGYYGGRTEAFYVGRPAPLPLHLLDVNSLYPWVMLDHRYPVRLLGVRDDGDLFALEAALDGGALVIAEVVIEVPVPCVPYADRERMKLLFPVGRFKTTLCSPELAIVRREGRIVSVARWSLYDGAPLFANYVSTIYADRLRAKHEGREAVSQLDKNLLVNLYGKFGQRSEEWVELGPWDGPDGSEDVMDLRTGESYTLRHLGGVTFRCAKAVEAYNSFPAIAAFVTSHGRAALWAAFLVAGGGAPPCDSRHVYYADTDSLFVDDVGRRNLERVGMVDPDGLGKLKVERTATERAIFYGAKAYQFDGYVRHKGIPLDARHAWDDGTPVVTPKGEPGAAFYLWPKTSGRLRRGETTFAQRLIVKRRTVDYEKAETTVEGWVKPWVLDATTDGESVEQVK
jgi:hypothetical protein